MGKQCIPDSGTTWVPTLRRGVEDWKQVIASLSQLYVRGARIDWAGVERGHKRRRLALPTYPFERQRCWIEDAERTRQTAARAGRENAGGGHPLLGQPFESARGETLYPTRLSLERQPFLIDHRIHGMCVLPAPVYMELALAAVRDFCRTPTATVEDLMVLEPLIVEEDKEYEVQVALGHDAESRVSVEIFSRMAPDKQGRWKKHATARGVMTEAGTASGIGMAPINELRQACSEGDRNGFYSNLHALGVEFGACFQGIERLWRRDGEAAGRIRVPAELSAAIAGFHLHPAVMDSCLQLLGASLPQGGEEAHDDNTYLMVGIDRYVLRQTPSTAFWCYARIRDTAAGGEVLTGDIFLLDDDGREIARLESVRLKRARRDALLRGARSDMDEWLYEVQWKPADDGHGASQTAIHLPPISLLAEGVSDLAEPLAIEHDLDQYQRLISALEELATCYVWRAIESLGWRPRAGEMLSAGALASQLGIAPRHSRLFGRLLEMLGEDGALTQANGGWQVVRVPAPSEPRTLASEIRVRYPQFDGEVAILEACGERLSGVLRGQVDAIHLLFPGGSMTAVEKLTQGAPAARAYNTLIRRIVETAAASTEDRPLRILEIGAGTGGTTSSVLPALPADRTEYFFTDVSRLFLSRAEQKFATYPFVRYRLLDIESDPVGQGFAAHEFDVIIAANVLHATSDLRRTLANVRQLLAPSGLLILLEGMGPQRWVDLTFGLTEGWWKFSDLDLRPSHPLLPRQGWLQLFADAGFQDATALPSMAAGDRRYAQQAIVLGKGPDAITTLRAETTEAHGHHSSRRWLLIGNGGGIAECLAPMLTEADVSCTRVLTGPHFAANGTNGFVLDPQQPADFDRLLAELPAESGDTITEAVHFLGCDSSDSYEPSVMAIDREVAAGCRSALYLAQALVRAQQTLKPRLWIVTRASQPAGQDLLPLNVGQSAIWGLGRTVANEHPEIWGGMIDADLDDIERTAALIAMEVDRESRDDQIAYRNGARYVARLRHAAPKSQAKPLQLRADRTYLVTGGTGGMGLKVASWLAEKGARHLMLTGRSGSSRVRPEELQALEASGVQVIVRAADAAREDHMRDVFAEIETTMPPLAGVIHVAGIFDDRVLMGHDWMRFEKVLAPKVRGGWILHELTRNRQLDFFVLFSSGASFLAPAGLGNYAAGNAFLDSLAHHRRRLGLPAISINWGPWEKVGMAEAVGDRREDQWTQAGFATMTPQQGLAVMERLMAGGAPQTGVLIVDWTKYCKRFGNAVPPMYADVTRQPVAAMAKAVAASASALEAFERALPAERKSLLIDHVRANVIEVLGFESGYRLDLEQGLFDLGMDSLTAVELKNRLQSSLGRSLPSTLLFDYPNVQKLSDYLARDVLQWTDVAVEGDGSRGRTDESIDRDALSEDELAQLLSRKLEQLR
jgi:acyl transferase domain-containing protein/acyl carrier protein